ncbi:MAG: Ni/Fe hydrogenase subunit alpha [bacterium]|nr:Ni/Fe hydrogenase subunit alpha [bacterium]
MKKITIDPITRLEGTGRIEIFLNDSGRVENVYLQVPELRGFEKFCEGRPVEELPRLTTRICGVCPGAHHIASGKALDDLYHVEPHPRGRQLREIFYLAHMIHSHILHFYFLAAPDFVLGPEADPRGRNIIGILGKLGVDLGKKVIRHRALAQEIQDLIGGKATHPVFILPGGVSRPISEPERKEILEKAKALLEFAKFSLSVFQDLVLGNPEYVDLIRSGPYQLKTYYLGLVDRERRLNFYDGNLRVVDPDGKEILLFPVRDYLKHLSERVEEWTFLKLPYLKKVGWQGLSEGAGNGIYRVGPLARLNVSEGLTTPLAQAEYERFFAVLGPRPVHLTLSQHWARLIELLYAAERLRELSADPDAAGEEVRNLPEHLPDEGFGVVEAPRGTLIHHFISDEKGIARGINLVVATIHNYPSLCLSVKKAAEAYLSGAEPSEGLLNRVEMAFRAYDPCLACATHTLPGGDPPLRIRFQDHSGVLFEISR